ESCNSVFAPLGAKVGAERLVRMARAFGFGETPAIPAAKPSTISSAEALRDDLAVGAAAIGQDRDLATPLQMATVGATIAAGGRRARPRIATIDPVVRRSVVSAATARQVRAMMVDAVRAGTGTAAAIPGVQVAGKTGTAELNIAQRINQPWFVGFAPVSRPKVAVAVTLERIQGPQSQGGAVAAPIAKVVMQELLR
ncbi:MAG: penicillin-binding transpeptidase domain-containing protein, partial [Solirubrobacteraceae bacterium]|nr:penicillin-binding transpeptidase domain-containing protein [Solirubrobacteraceae bacterium]